MNYAQFCGAVDKLLADKPPYTGIRIGSGHMMHDADRNLIAVADGGTVDDGFDVDSSAWEDDAFEGMTGPETDKALANPESKQFTA